MCYTLTIIPCQSRVISRSVLVSSMSTVFPSPSFRKVQPLHMASVTSALPQHTSSRLREIGAFALVGVANTALDFAILNGLILLTHQDRGAWLFGFDLFAFSVGMLSSYFLNARVTFRQSDLASGGRVLRFLAVSIV